MDDTNRNLCIYALKGLCRFEMRSHSRIKYLLNLALLHAFVLKNVVSVSKVSCDFSKFDEHSSPLFKNLTI